MAMQAISYPLLAAAIALPVAGAIAQVPLPPPRPGEPVKEARAAPLPPRRPTAPVAPLPARPMQAGDVPLPDADAASCADLLAEKIATIEITASKSGLSGGALCGDEAPVRMTAIRLRDGSEVALKPAVVARCEMALQFARWIRDDIVPVARQSGLEIEAVEIAASYACRPRNNVAGAKLSEHGLANAVDVSAIVASPGRRIAITGEDAPVLLLAEMRRSACARFTTVLGPGADAAHEHHLHVDLARRRSGYRLCQWNMPDWPLP